MEVVVRRHVLSWVDLACFHPPTHPAPSYQQVGDSVWFERKDGLLEAGVVVDLVREGGRVVATLHYKEKSWRGTTERRDVAELLHEDRMLQQPRARRPAQPVKRFAPESPPRWQRFPRVLKSASRGPRGGRGGRGGRKARKQDHVGGGQASDGPRHVLLMHSSPSSSSDGEAESKSKSKSNGEGKGEGPSAAAPEPYSSVPGFGTWTSIQEATSSLPPAPDDSSVGEGDDEHEEDMDLTGYTEQECKAWLRRYLQGPRSVERRATTGTLSYREWCLALRLLAEDLGGVDVLEKQQAIKGVKRCDGMRLMYGAIRAPLIQEMVRFAHVTKGDRFIDIGSGLGTVVLQMAAVTGC